MENNFNLEEFDLKNYDLKNFEVLKGIILQFSPALNDFDFENNKSMLVSILASHSNSFKNNLDLNELVEAIEKKDYDTLKKIQLEAKKVLIYEQLAYALADIVVAKNSSVTK